MENPTICTWDNRTYEDSAIRKWLTTNRYAPLNVELMPQALAVDDVLKPNINIKDAIDDYKAKNTQSTMAMNSI